MRYTIGLLMGRFSCYLKNPCSPSELTRIGFPPVTFCADNPRTIPVCPIPGPTATVSPSSRGAGFQPAEGRAVRPSLCHAVILRRDDARLRRTPREDRPRPARVKLPHDGDRHAREGCGESTRWCGASQSPLWGNATGDCVVIGDGSELAPSVAPGNAVDHLSSARGGPAESSREAGTLLSTGGSRHNPLRDVACGAEFRLRKRVTAGCRGSGVEDRERPRPERQRQATTKTRRHEGNGQSPTPRLFDSSIPMYRDYSTRGRKRPECGRGMRGGGR